MNNVDHVKVIYREDSTGVETENRIFENLMKKGVWILYGKDKTKQDGRYECLNVAKSINVGSEILYDIACLKYLRDKKIVILI